MEETLLWNKVIKTWSQIFEILGFPGMLGASLFAEQVESEFELQSQVLTDPGHQASRFVMEIPMSDNLSQIRSWRVGPGE